MAYIYGPAAVFAQWKGRMLRRLPTSEGLRIGEPLYEAEGVPNRRGLIAHEMSADQVASIDRMLREDSEMKAANLRAVVFTSDLFPADWRWSA